MLRKIILIIIFAFSLVGCDGDYEQGICDEGFFEQTDGNGGTLCAPISDFEAFEDGIPNPDNLDKTD